VGTPEEYNVAFANGQIAVGALVILLDNITPETSEITSMLGKAIIGKMILGLNK
jgi:hypothetical protein